MEKQKKRWEDLEAGEKTSLLDHWFYYYGGMMMTLKDIAAFRELSATRQDDIFSHIVTNFVYHKTIQSNLLLLSMRNGKIDELFGYSIRPEDIKPGKEESFENVRGMILGEMLGSFISPEPPVPMDIHIVIQKEDKPPQK